MSVFDLQPGQEEILHGLIVKFYNVGETPDHTGFVKSLEPEGNPYIQQACRWSIGDDYFRESVQKAKYQIYVYYTDSYGHKGVHGFVLASDTEDPEGLYIDLVCSSEFWSQKLFDERGGRNNKDGDINFTLGNILQTTMILYGYSIGKRNLYAHAADAKVLYNRMKQGWSYNQGSCPAQRDDISNYQDFAEYAKGLPTEPHGYPISYCQFDPDQIRDEAVTLYNRKISVVNPDDYPDAFNFA